MTPKDERLLTATAAVAALDVPIVAPDVSTPADAAQDGPQSLETTPQTADAASPTAAIAAQAVAEFEALVDEIAVELEAVWDDDDALDASASDGPFGGATEPSDGSRTDRIRRYARELCAAAYVNRDNSAWDPTVAQSYCNAEADDALLPMLLESSTEGDDTENDQAEPADAYLPEEPEASEEGHEGAFADHALTHENETAADAQADAELVAAEPVLMRCHV